MTPSTDIQDCCKLMEDYQIRRVIVVDEGGECCGIVSQADIARKAPNETNHVLEAVSKPSPFASNVNSVSLR